MWENLFNNFQSLPYGSGTTQDNVIPSADAQGYQSQMMPMLQGGLFNLVQPKKPVPGQAQQPQQQPTQTPLSVATSGVFATA